MAPLTTEERKSGDRHRRGLISLGEDVIGNVHRLAEDIVRARHSWEPLKKKEEVVKTQRKRTTPKKAA